MRANYACKNRCVFGIELTRFAATDSFRRMLHVAHKKGAWRLYRLQSLLPTNAHRQLKSHYSNLTKPEIRDLRMCIFPQSEANMFVIDRPAYHFTVAAIITVNHLTARLSAILPGL